MTFQQASALISPAEPFLSMAGGPTGTAVSSEEPRYWADLGCGSGLFTKALAQLLPTGSTVYGVDTHPTLRQQDINSGSAYSIIPIQNDFINDVLKLPMLDGILMANSLHYVKDKPALIKKLRSYMRPGSPLLIVEYDTDQPVPTWVPYPIRYDALVRFFANDAHVQKLGERPSVFGHANIYAALIQPR